MKSNSRKWKAVFPLYIFWLPRLTWECHYMEKELRFDTCKVLALLYFHLWHTEKGSEYFSFQFLLQSSMDQCLSLAHSLSTRGFFLYFSCAEGLCGSSWMLYCWHFWLICLNLPEFLPDKSHGKSPEGKLCRHHQFIVLLLLFRAIYIPGLLQVRNPQLVCHPWTQSSPPSPELLLVTRWAGTHPFSRRSWTDMTVWSWSDGHTRTFSSGTFVLHSISNSKGEQIEEEQEMEPC